MTSVFLDTVVNELIWTFLLILLLVFIDVFSEIIPFEMNSSSLNKLLTKAKARYGSFTIIGLQFLGRYLIYFSSIKHALAFIFCNSLRYLILKRKINHYVWIWNSL